jgi:hypothetical protein
MITSTTADNIPIHVEVCLKSNSTAKTLYVSSVIFAMLKKKEYEFKQGEISLSELASTQEETDFMIQNVSRVLIAEHGTWLN